MVYDATLANSFDADYEMFYGSDAALMLRDGKAWMFKETDSALGGWEVYCAKQKFYKDTGIALVANASKSVQIAGEAPKPFTETPLAHALGNFLKNTNDLMAAEENYKASFGTDDPDGLKEVLAKVVRRASAGYLEGYQATVTAIKANEAILSRQRIEIKPELYELG
jgi:hypothetical protein